MMDICQIKSNRIISSHGFFLNLFKIKNYVSNDKPHIEGLETSIYDSYHRYGNFINGKFKQVYYIRFINTYTIKTPDVISSYEYEL